MALSVPSSAIGSRESKLTDLVYPQQAAQNAPLAQLDESESQRQRPLAAILEAVLSEIDVLLRRRLEESQLEVPHLIIAAAKDGQAALPATSVPIRFGQSARTLSKSTTRSCRRKAIRRIEPKGA
jgi:hypothetical protein